MRFHNIWEEILSSSVKIRVVRLLSNAPPVHFTGRSIASLVGATPQRVRQVLNLLRSHRLIYSQRAGAALIWDVNTEHVLWPLLRDLFGWEAEFSYQLNKELTRALPKERVVRAILFGSVARKEEGPSSDIDLFVVVRHPADKLLVEERLHRASIRFIKRYGNGISPFVLTEAEFTRESKRKFGVVSQAVREGLSLLPMGH